MTRCNLNFFRLLISVAYAAENWCAHKNMYLAGYTKGGKDFSVNVEAALRKCKAMGVVECGGVTKEPSNGGGYTLRKGRVLKETPADRKGVYSYKRGSCETGSS